VPETPRPDPILTAMEPATSRWITEATARHSGTLLVYAAVLALGNALGATVDRRTYIVFAVWIGLNLIIAPWAARPTEYASRLRRYAMTIAMDVVFLGAVYYFLDAAQWLGAVFFIHSALVAAATLPRRWATGIAGLIVVVFVTLVWMAVAGPPPVISPVGLPSVQGNYRWAVSSIAASLGLIVVLMMLQLRLVATIRDAEQGYRERLRLIVGALDFGFYTIDTEGRLTAIHGQWADEQEATGRRLIGARLLEVMPPEAAEPHREANARALAGEDVTLHWTLAADATHGERFFRSHLAPLRDGGGTIVGVAGVWNDETVTTVAQRERETLRTRLVDAERIESLGNLVSGVAHELNNPLAAILNFTEDLLVEPRSGDERMALEVIQAQALRSRTIVRDLLTFVRQGERRPRKPETPGAILDAVFRAVRPGLATQDVSFTTAVSERDTLLLLDRAGFEQVVTNLLANAAHAAGEAAAAGATGATGAVQLTARRTDDCYEVIVEDNGPGIPEENFARIFEPFFTTKITGQGVGLGLSVSLGIAQAHGGTLTAENRVAPEGGARFTMRLPLSGSRFRRHTPSTSMQPMPERKPSLLIVDDEESIRRALRRYFERRGWVVDEATDGADALVKLDRPDAPQLFDVLLCDLKMPGISGQALYAELLRDRPALAARFIFATGDAGAPDVIDFLGTVGVPVLEKPFELRSLELVAQEVRSRSAGSARPPAPVS
jgi:signal transduction histidine kinase/ActR/RegA family two-component response regulator